MKTIGLFLLSRSVNAASSQWCNLAKTTLAAFLLLSGVIARADPCVITNEGDAFALLTGARDTNGRVTLSWESCNEHLYEVQTSDESPTPTIWLRRVLMIGGDGTTSWTDTNAPAHPQRFYRVQRLRFGGDEDGDGLSNLDEFNRGTDLRKADTDGDGMPDGWEVSYGFNPLDPGDAPTDLNGLPVSMIVGQTATLRAFGVAGTCTCQWSVVSGKAFFTNTVTGATDFIPSWSGAVTVQVACARSGVVHTNRSRTVAAFPSLSPISGWNDPNVQPYNNCYNFATDIRTDTFAQPGGLPLSSYDCPGETSGAIADGLKPGVDLNDLCHTSGLPGGHIVALLIWSPYVDYHWVRMEADGTWSGKFGTGPATSVDNSGLPITDPRTANFGSYQFCGFFWVGPDVHVY